MRMSSSKGSPIKPDFSALWLMGAALVTIVLLAMMTSEMQEREVDQFDQYVRLFVHRYSSSSLTIVMEWITRLGSPMFLFVASTANTVVLWWKRRPGAATFVVVTLL